MADEHVKGSTLKFCT